MNHKVMCMLMVTLAMIIGVSQAWGSMLSLASETAYSIPYTGDPYDIVAEGNLDWVVCMYSEKADTSVITTDGATALESFDAWGWIAGSGYPTFSWTGGIPSAPEMTGAVSGLEYGNVGTHLAIPAGSGTVTIWWAWAVAPGPAEFTATFDDLTTVSSSTYSALKTVLNYSTDTAQTLTFSGNAYAGVFAMAVSQVPEPSTLMLLGIGLAAASVYARRRQK